MDTPPPQHYQQQQQVHAGPDQEVVEVKQLLQQALGSSGLLNHVKASPPPFPLPSLLFLVRHQIITHHWTSTPPKPQKALLVAGVHLATDGIRDGQRAEASIADLRLLHPNQKALAVAETEEGRLALGLVADLLESLGLRQSLSVFLPEANLDDGRASGGEQQQQQQPSQWKSQRQAQAAALGLDVDAGSEDSLILQFVRRQVRQQRLRTETERKEEGEGGEGERGEEEGGGEGEASPAVGEQEEPLVVVQQEAEKEGDEEDEGEVEEAIAYEEEEGEGGSRYVLGWVGEA